MLKLFQFVRKYFFYTIALVAIVYIFSTIWRYQKYRVQEIVINLDLPKLTAYTIAKSYVQGDSIPLYLHADGNYIGEIWKLGEQTPQKVGQIEGTTNQQTADYSTKYGHNWNVSKMIATESWKAGFYLIALRLKTDETVKFSLPILIRSKTGNRIVVVSPTHTWQAYNDYGGKSNYRDYIAPKDLRYLFKWLGEISARLSPYTYLPKRRPLDHKLAITENINTLSKLNGKISSDLHLLEFLEQINENYDVISDEDFEKGIGVEKAQLIFFNNHSEYWSYEGIGILKDLLSNGVNVAFLSGNNLYRGVESIENESLIVMEQQLPRPAIEPIVGTFYSESGYQTFGSFKVIEDSHWIFENTGLKKGQKFGNNLISGVETDKKGPYSNDFTLVAIGDNQSGPAHMVVKDFPKGNFLFNASSVSSVRAIKEDLFWQAIIQNLINRGMLGMVGKGKEEMSLGED